MMITLWEWQNFGIQNCDFPTVAKNVLSFNCMAATNY